MRFGRSDRILVVGAGAAGLAAAAQVRRLGFPGQVVVLGAEECGPYDRPACSKGLITGHQIPRDVRLPLPEDVHVELGRRAMALDPDAHTVTVDTGQEIVYDGLVIATGGTASLPKGWPDDEPGMHLMHNIGDAIAVRRDMRDAERVAIVGGGLTGCEVACAVRSMAREAIIIDSRRVLMHRAIGEPIGGLVTWAHQDKGIETRLGRRVKEARRWRGQWRLMLDDGDWVYADMVVVTTGERPDTGWLKDSGLDVSDGVPCDETLRVLGAEDIVAAGVVARWPNLRYGPQQIRVGQWIAAMEQGAAAAGTLLAGQHVVPPMTLLPRFWSYQDDLRIQVCGQIESYTEVALTEMRPGRRDIARAGVLASYYDDGRLTGLVAVNAPRAFTATTRALLADVPDVVPPSYNPGRHPSGAHPTVHQTVRIDVDEMVGVR